MANVRIPQLTPAISLSGAEQLEIAVPTGDLVVPFVSRRTTAQAIAGLINFFILPGTVLIVSSGTVVDVAATVRAVILNTVGPVTINLSSVGLRSNLPLQISDFGGLAGDITVNASAGETVMGLSSALLISNGQGVGIAAGITLWPNATLNGWYVA